MQERLEPKVFYGAAIAALVGLLSGLVLHVAWQKHPGGPRIMLGSAAAAEVVNPNRGSPSADPVELADRDSGPVTPDPLPVTRLAPDMFDVEPAAADEAERQDVGDVVADVAPQAPPRDLD